MILQAPMRQDKSRGDEITPHIGVAEHAVTRSLCGISVESRADTRVLYRARSLKQCTALVPAEMEDMSRLESDRPWR